MLQIDRKVYDILGIGIGPFNLGLAAMAESFPHLNCIFFDQSKQFNWHSGMLLSTARLQVPFYADLITVVDPCSKYTYLNYLKEKGRLFRFAIHENNFVTRKEYNDYCKWVAEQMDGLHFHHKVADVHYDPKEDLYTVMVHNLSSDKLLFYHAKHLVVGVGSVPHLPELRNGIMPSEDSSLILHSSDYLHRKDDILECENITVVGSGQSAAEIFYDLLQYDDHLKRLSWFTRSPRFYPMEYSKLSLEMTSPDYIEHFYSLPVHKKKEVLRTQDALYKGINFSLINDIYDALYLKSLDDRELPIQMRTYAELNHINQNNDELELHFYHSASEQTYTHTTNALILATGYEPATPVFLESIKDHLLWTEDGFYDVNRNYSIDVSGKRIFVQNAELHSHGFSAPDLGMGPYRNAVILNNILGCEHFKLEKKIAFQDFGIPY